MNLQEVLDRLDILRRFTGLRIQDFYNKMLASGWTLRQRPIAPRSAIHHRRLSPADACACSPIAGANPIRTWSFPSFLISIPELNESLQLAYPGRPFVTILTDLANYPPRFWIEKQRPGFHLRHRARPRAGSRSGHPPATASSRIRNDSSSTIYEPIETSHAARPAIARPLARPSYGPHPLRRPRLKRNRGYRRTRSIIDSSNSSSSSSAAATKSSPISAFTHGRIPRLRRRIHQADSVLHASLRFFHRQARARQSERSGSHELPVITECNSWTLPQERYNADWIREKEIGLVVRQFPADRTSRAPAPRPGHASPFQTQHRQHAQSRRLRNPRHPRPNFKPLPARLRPLLIRPN